MVTIKERHIPEPSDIIQLLDKGVFVYYFYTDKINDIRRGAAESDIILVRLNKDDI